MKTKICKLIVLSAVSLILAGMVISCKDKEKDINPIIATEEINAFFEAHLPAISGSNSNCFFVDDNNSNKCTVINSNDDFSQNFTCPSIAPPAIDFDTYTLVVGQYEVPSTNYQVIKQNITSQSSKLTLNLTLKIPEESYPSFCMLYYWGLYPKLKNSNVNINVITQK